VRCAVGGRGRAPERRDTRFERTHARRVRRHESGERREPLTCLAAITRLAAAAAAPGTAPGTAAAATAGTAALTTAVRSGAVRRRRGPVRGGRQRRGIACACRGGHARRGGGGARAARRSGRTPTTALAALTRIGPPLLRVIAAAVPLRAARVPPTAALVVAIAIAAADAPRARARAAAATAVTPPRASTPAP
jgi:hypothetical protein